MDILQHVVILTFIMELVSAEMTINTSSDGKYVISIDGAQWLYSAATHFQADNLHHSTSDGSLKLQDKPTVMNGSDLFGTYQGLSYTWKAAKNVIQTDIRHYDDVQAVVFSQIFPLGLSGTSVGSMNGVVSGFPTFKLGSDQAKVGWMAYSGLFIGWYGLKYGRWHPGAKLPGGIESGPVVMFDTQDNVVIISAFSQFMASSYADNTEQGSVDWGVMGDAHSIPQGYQYDTIVYHSTHGINKAMEEWGELLRRWYHRSTAARDIDPSIGYISYYTDNGAYYRNFREPKLTYEETIQAIVNYAHHINIPYRSIQLDDWWYPIKGPGYGATITWTANPKIFPHGLQYIYNLTHWPVVGHNRYWSNITPYAEQNGGRFNFIMDDKLSLPDDQSFWDYLMAGAKKWGLIVYEQDWLNYHVEQFKPLHKDVTLGRRWLHQMGEAATRFGLQIQYCMSLPRHLLASLEVPAVSQIRASTDYHLSDNQWAIGITSIFAHAMGLAPFKDNLWTQSMQPGNVYNKTEPNPLLQVTVALLSTGPVGIGDRVGYSDSKLLNRLINADGLLLKPSKPATAIDKQIQQLAFGDTSGPDGEVWSTYSHISDLIFGIVFCPSIQTKYIAGPQELGLPDVEYGAYSYTFDPVHEETQPFSSRSKLTLYNCTYTHFCMYHTSPVLMYKSRQLIILGELSKLVPMSSHRVTSVKHDSYDVLVTIVGVPNETVTFYFRYNNDNVKIDCTISNLGSAVISWNKQTCH